MVCLRLAGSTDLLDGQVEGVVTSHMQQSARSLGTYWHWGFVSAWVLCSRVEGLYKASRSKGLKFYGLLGSCGCAEVFRKVSPMDGWLV